MSPSDLANLQNVMRSSQTIVSDMMWLLVVFYLLFVGLLMAPFLVAAIAFWRWVSWRIKYPAFQSDAISSCGRSRDFEPLRTSWA